MEPHTLSPPAESCVGSAMDAFDTILRPPVGLVVVTEVTSNCGLACGVGEGSTISTGPKFVRYL